MRRKKNRGIESLKRRYGLIFITPWLAGVALFVIAPVLKTLLFSFSIVKMGDTGLQTQFVGIRHYYRLLVENTLFVDRLAASLTGIFTSLPIIICLSLIFALVLNQKFKGRMLMRSIFFLPVIISSGVVMYILSGADTSDAGNLTSTLNAGAGTSSYVDAIDFSSILSRLNLPADINNLMMDYLSNTFNLIWSCGVQTLLFIAGLQTIPNQLYEVGRVEGATAWESFWYITVPMLSRVLMLVLFYTMLELFIDNSALVESALNDMRWHSIYDSTSAQLWIYFLCVGLVMGLVMWLYSKVFIKRWR